MRTTVNPYLKYSFRRVAVLPSTGRAILLLHGKQYKLSLLPMVWKVPALAITYLPTGFLMNTKKKKQWMVIMIHDCKRQLLFMTKVQVIRRLTANPGSIQLIEFIQKNTPG